jgi:hypothetical protein
MSLMFWLAYISVQSGNKANEVFDSLSGLRGPPDTKVLKGRDRSLRSDLQLPIRRAPGWRSRSQGRRTTTARCSTSVMCAPRCVRCAEV